MKIPLVLPLFLSSTDHSYNAALRLFGPPAMFGNDIVPALPTNAVTETNRETLTRLRHDLACVDKQLLSAADEYRMYVDDGHNQPAWGYCVESASVEDPRDILVLMRVVEGRARSVTLRWLSMSKVHTRKNAHLLYRVVDTEGPAENVMIEFLKVFRDVFECAVEDGWSYEKRLEFYHAFPFEELSSVEAVRAFHPILFGSPAFSGCEPKVPEAE